MTPEKRQKHTSTAALMLAREGQYLYDASGNRVKKIVVDQQGNYTATNYIDGSFEYQMIEDTNGTHERNYVHINDNKSRIATQRVGSDYEDISEDAFYILEDHLNSVNKRLNATNGGVIDVEEFYPFGESSYQNFSKKRYRFCGKEKDNESGLYYYGLRYYSAWSCRFISVDPLSAKYPAYTSYQYAGNKPITFIDLDGGEETENTTTNTGSSGTGSGNVNTNNTQGGNANLPEIQNPYGTNVTFPVDNVGTKPTVETLEVNPSVTIDVGQGTNSAGEREDFTKRTDFNSGLNTNGALTVLRDINTGEILGQHYQRDVEVTADRPDNRTMSEKMQAPFEAFGRMVENNVNLPRDPFDKVGVQLSGEVAGNIPGASGSISYSVGVYEYSEGNQVVEHNVGIQTKEHLQAMTDFASGKYVSPSVSFGFVFDFKGQSSSSWFISGSYDFIKVEYNSQERELFIGVSTENKGFDIGKSQKVVDY